MMGSFLNKLYLYITCLLISVSSPSFTAEFQIKDVVFKNIKWKTSPNEKIPHADSYDVEFTLSNDHVLTASFNRNNLSYSMPEPYASLDEGDIVEILDEGFILKEQHHSWFKVFHFPLMLEFDAKGNNLKSKYITSEPSHIKIQDVRLDHPKQISFKINGIYVSAQVDSDKYHGYYENMPMIIQWVHTSEENEWGQFHYLFGVEKLEMQEEQELISFPMNNRTDIHVDQFNPTNVRYLKHSYHPPLRAYFNIKFVLGDGSEYVTEKEYIIERGTLEGYVDALLTNLGKEWVIIEEVLDKNNEHNSIFKFQSLNTGDVLEVIGPARAAHKLITSTV